MSQTDQEKEDARHQLDLLSSIATSLETIAAVLVENFSKRPEPTPPAEPAEGSNNG